ncbi:MAG TPA: iron-siderophore ABC transporter substrate-binding protein [Pseudolysinimonas sp.]|nr:iron-siderophore ABC transporter substrate-binding protein [Pseudolysinimonas sp.]
MARSRTRRIIPVVAAVAAALSLALAGCSAPADASSDGAITIEHTFGKSVIPETPKRVVTIGWGSADAAIALGVIPVAIPFQSYGGDKNGVLPWIAEALKKDDAKTPTILPDSGDDPPYKEIAAAKPDVILAVLSGITKEQYDLLSDIAPVVAYPGEAWATPWREVIDIVGKALNREDAAAKLQKSIDSKISAAAAEHPEFAGKTLAAVSDSGGTFYVYKDEDPRVEFMLDLGFVSAPAVNTLDTDESTFYFTLSYEKLDQLDADVVVSYAATQDEQDAFLNSSYAQLLPAVKNGTVAAVTGTEFVASVSPPTALSLTWGLNDLVAKLAEATK